MEQKYVFFISKKIYHIHMALIFPNIDPVAIAIGSLQIRWYALAYLSGFVLGLYYCKKIAAQKVQSKPDVKDIDDFMTWAIAGVILGGRIGYVLFYQFAFYLQNPIEIFMIWHGGMSFHGGVIGVAFAMLIFAKSRGFHVLNLSDVVSAAAPLGIFFGRIANFINAELYGKVTDVPWAFIFPRSDGLARHPSQLYEAFSEGLILFLILYILIYKFDFIRKRGFITGAFLCLYGSFRALIEFVREPDDYLGLIVGFISMGQILCIPMILIGGLLIFLSLKNNQHDATTANNL